MATLTIACPHCTKTEGVIYHGYNRSGTERCLCHLCKRTFTLLPKSRKLSEEKESLIREALKEKTPYIAICRMLKVSPKTVYAVLKKT